MTQDAFIIVYIKYFLNIFLRLDDTYSMVVIYMMYNAISLSYF